MLFPMESAARGLSLARRLFIPIALGFLAYTAYRAGDLTPNLASLSVPYLLLAWLCWAGAQWIGPLTTLGFARIFDLRLGYRELSLISVLRLPAKYLPGGIWQSVSRFTAYRRLEVSKSDSFFILVAEHLLALGVSVALGAALLHYLEGTQFFYGIAAWALTGALALLTIMVLKVFSARGTGRQVLLGVLISILATVVFWVVAAASFCAYWAATFGQDGVDILRVAACYLLAWAAGFLTLFAPQGLGVFEWVGGHLLPSEWPFDATVIAVAGFRILTIAADLSAWAIGLAISRMDAR